jgi:transducin (beta)-like 1
VHKEIKAHKGPVADLKWQPLSNPSTAADENSERLFATAGEDSLVKIWNARGGLSKPKITITMENPVLALAFTPDGAFLAAATNTQILIWSMEDSSVPRARWRRGTEPGWQSPRSINGQPLEEDVHSLCWDANGQRLVYGVNSMVCTIDLHDHVKN